MPIIDTWIFLFPLFYSVFFFSNSLKAAIPWTRRRSAGAASAFSPPSPEEGTEYFIRKGIVPEAEREVCEYGFAITICTIASTLGLLLGQFLGGAVLIALFYTCQSSGGGYHASTHLRCFLTMCAGLPAGLGFSLLPCPLWALAVLAVPLTLHLNKLYLLENKKALILRSALSRLYAKAHYRPAS